LYRFALKFSSREIVFQQLLKLILAPYQNPFLQPELIFLGKRADLVGKNLLRFAFSLLKQGKISFVRPQDQIQSQKEGYLPMKQSMHRRLLLCLVFPGF
jgi:hypothetical protein